MASVYFSTQKTMTKLAIINNHDSFTYNLVDLIRRLHVQFDVINVENLSLDRLEDYSHILISPGPDVPKSYPQLVAMLTRFYQQKTILGVCLGHQTICEFFGATLFNLPNVRHGQKSHLKVQSNSVLFQGLPNHFEIGLYHSWAVSTENFPTELEITATCDDEIIMAFQHHTLPIFGVQFHPESYMSEYGLWILKNFLNLESRSYFSEKDQKNT
ncbi:anthranilate synthase component II [Lonepinella sp. MS14437]|uniref:anthranilate synthase component II n=1 Tax=Lonepinella sp. MS14437 TaxID=3003620 RepID=UPI0036DAB693